MGVGNEGFGVDSRLVAVLNGVSVDVHGRPGHGLAIGQVDGAIDQILQFISIPNFNINALITVGEGRDISRGKRCKKHQHHQENWLRFSDGFV